MQQKITYGQITGIKDNFTKIIGTIPGIEYFGLVKKGYKREINFEDILRNHSNNIPGAGIIENTRNNLPLFIKKLKESEMNEIPAIRFRNSVAIERSNLEIGCISPLALIYSGTGPDLLSFNSKGYFISHYIPGSSLMEILHSIDEKEKDRIFSKIGIIIKEYQSKGMYFLDIAPRDIVIPHGDSLNWPVIVDTENVLFSSTKDNYVIKRKQISEFRKEYSLFYDKETLDNLVNKVFH